MANTDEVIPKREILYEGDIAYRRANAETIMGRFASTNNFVSKYQVDYVSFFLNGSYSITSGLYGYDGAYTAFYRSRIIGIQMFNAISGTSGITELDIRWLDTSGADQGSIFATTPKINSTSASPTRLFRNLETGNDFTMTGCTLPELSKNFLEEGETIYLAINSTMLQAENCGITLNVRPTTETSI